MLFNCLVFFTLLLFSAKTEAQTTESIMEIESMESMPAYTSLFNMVQSATENCFMDREKTQPVLITDAGLRGLLNGERLDVPRDTKCLRYCIMRKSSLINDDILFNLENMVNFFQNLSIELDSEEELSDIIENCNIVAMEQTDRCDRAHSASTCILGHISG